MKFKLSGWIFFLATFVAAPLATAAPAAPMNLSALAISTSQINIYWQDSSNNEEGFIIERSLSSSSGFTRIASVAAGITSFNSTSLAPATVYYYRVAAFTKYRKQMSLSAYSNIVSAKTFAFVPTTTTTIPTTGTWTRCAIENGTCQFMGTREVRYGANGIFTSKVLTGPVACNNATFGDPVYGVAKACDYSSVLQSSPSTTLPPPSSTTLPPPPTTTTIPTSSTSVGAPSTLVAPGLTPIPSTVLPIPTNIANGAVVSLQCGQVYSGTLNLDGKSNVTVNVAGTCGKPTIVPLSGKDGISAVSASSIKIEGLKIQSSYRGINVNNARTVSILNTDILNSSNTGIYVAGVSGMTVDRCTVTNSGKSGIGGWAPSYSSVTNTLVTGAGNPSVNYSSSGIYDSGQGIALDGMTNKIDHSTVIRSSYFGIVAGTDGSFVTNNLVDQACNGPDSDCGGIYTQGRDQTKRLNLLIQGNVVRNIRGVGIYLDNESAYVTVDRNSVTNAIWSMLVNSGVYDVISNNTFTSATTGHMALNEFAGVPIHDLKITQNVFKSTNGEQTYNLMGQGMKSFGIYDYNTYSSTNVNNFARMWDATSNPGFTLSYTGWKNYQTGQDTNSTMNGVP